MITNLPNLLTLGRIVLIPGMVVGLYLETATGNWIAFGFFAIAAITDFFDGYIARMKQQHTAFGRFLDPVADKLLVGSALLVLAGLGHITGLVLLPALIILCREILVSGLREYLGGLQVSVPVTKLAKWKTTIQLVALGVLIVGEAGPAALHVQLVGEVLLWIAAAFTLVTGYDYLRAGLRHMDPEGPAVTRGEQADQSVAERRAAGGSGAE